MSPLGFAKVGWQGGAGFSPVVASGGSTATYTDGGVEYKAHTFTNSGTFSVSDAGSEGLLEIMLLGGGGAGGGGGANDTGGGGGAGGLLLETLTISATGSYPVTVGNGAAGTRWRSSDGVRGNDSTLKNPSATVIASGRRGGGGASAGAHGSSGGSGGGSGDPSRQGGAREVDSTNFPSTAQGNAGFDATNSTGGGGGGAKGNGNTIGSSPGTNQNTVQGDGGAGFAVNYRNGNNVTYGGGGGGGGNVAGSGGAGGGTAGSTNNNQANQPTANAGVNTGGGSGGAHAADNYATGNGGKGIVIIRYLTGN